MQQWETKKVVIIYRNLAPYQRTKETAAVFASSVTHVLLRNRDILSRWHTVMEVTMETWVMGAEEILRGWRMLQSPLCVQQQLCRVLPKWSLLSVSRFFPSWLPSLKRVQLLAAMQEAMNHSITGRCSQHSRSSTKLICCFSVYFHLRESMGGNKVKEVQYYVTE